MSKDKKFPKKYMFGMAMLLKKGLHINFIHDVNRPLNEMLLGLECNIPMYMTGQISPYYFKEYQGGVFHHHIKVSGAAALVGDAVNGSHDKGRYILTKSREEVRYYREQSKYLMKNAKPLMRIFKENNKEDYYDLIRKASASSDQKLILSTPPLFTATGEFLRKILGRNGIKEEIVSAVIDFSCEHRQIMTELLQEHNLSIEVPYMTEEEWQKNPLMFSLANIFSEEKVEYTFEEYCEHYNMTKDFSDKYENGTFIREASPVFSNISITIFEGKCVIVSKRKSPAIHFSIHHPKMIRAFEKFIPPVKK